MVRVRVMVRVRIRDSEGAPSQDLAPLVEASLLCELVYPDQSNLTGKGWARARARARFKRAVVSPSEAALSSSASNILMAWASSC